MAGLVLACPGHDEKGRSRPIKSLFSHRPLAAPTGIDLHQCIRTAARPIGYQIVNTGGARNIMRRILLAGFLLGTMALGAPPAHATTITQYGSGGPAGHDTFDVVFQQAHLAPGDVLNSVTLVIAGFAWATAYIEPDESFPVWAFVHASVGVTVNGPGIPYKPPYTWPDFDLLGTVIPVDGIATTSLYNGSASLGPVDRSPTLDHAAYVGPGTVSIAVSVSEDSDVCDVFGGSILCNMGLNWTVALVYDITEVPEPSALLIVSGAGMVSIASGRRARSCRRLNAV